MSDPDIEDIRAALRGERASEVEWRTCDPAPMTLAASAQRMKELARDFADVGEPSIYIYEPPERQESESDRLWEQFHREGGVVLNGRGEVIGTVGPAEPNPDDPGAFVVPYSPRP